MINRKFFFDHAKATLFGGRLAQPQVDGTAAILDAFESRDKYAYHDPRHLAYILATAYHETDRSMRPIEEYGKGKGKRYGTCTKLSGKPYADTKNLFYGRGFAQLTWYENYLKAGQECGVDLIDNPEKALELPVATQILIEGMYQGWFTGKKLADYFSLSREDWAGARRIVNGTDKANLIAGHAKRFYACISETPGVRTA